MFLIEGNILNSLLSHCTQDLSVRREMKTRSEELGEVVPGARPGSSGGQQGTLDPGSDSTAFCGPCPIGKAAVTLTGRGMDGWWPPNSVGGICLFIFENFFGVREIEKSWGLTSAPRQFPDAQVAQVFPSRRCQKHLAGRFRPGRDLGWFSHWAVKGGTVFSAGEKLPRIPNGRQRGGGSSWKGGLSFLDNLDKHLWKLRIKRRKSNQICEFLK